MIKKLLLLSLFISNIALSAMIPDQYWNLNLTRDQVYKLDIIGDKYTRAIRYEENVMINLSRSINALNKIKNKTPEQLQSLSMSMQAMGMANDRRGLLIMQRDAEMQRYLSPEQLQKLNQY